MKDRGVEDRCADWRRPKTRERAQGAQVHEHGRHALAAQLGRLVNRIEEVVVVRLILLAVDVVQDLDALAVQLGQLRHTRDAPLDVRDNGVLLRSEARHTAEGGPPLPGGQLHSAALKALAGPKNPWR